jgi:ribokinase
MAHFDAGDMLVLKNEIAHTKDILEQARKKELRICFNPSPYNRSIEDLPLDAADNFFVNEIERAGLAQLPAETPAPPVLDNLVKRFPKAEIILTAGREGAYYGFGSLRKKGEIADMPVTDTTGSGDTFTGFFSAARIKGYTLAESLKIAGTAASIAVSRKGAMEPIPFGEEVFRGLSRAYRRGLYGGLDK